MEPEIIRMPEVIKQTGLSKATIYREIKRGRFPKAVQLTERLVGWRLKDVKRWAENRRLSS